MVMKFHNFAIFSQNLSNCDLSSALVAAWKALIIRQIAISVCAIKMWKITLMSILWIINIWNRSDSYLNVLKLIQLYIIDISGNGFIFQDVLPFTI